MGNRLFSILLLLVIAINFGDAPLFAQDTARESSYLAPNSRIISRLSYFLDADGRFLQKPESVLQQAFSPLNNPNEHNFGYSNATVWMRFTMELGAESSQHLVLTMNQSSLNRVTLYQIQSGRLVLLAKSGGSVAAEERSIDTQGIHVDFGNLGPGVAEYLLQLEAKGGLLETSFSIHPERQWVANWMTASLLFRGLFFGLLVALMVSNGMTWYLTRQRVYLDYVMYVASIVLIVANFDGILDWLLPWPQIGGWTQLTPIFTNLVAIALFLMHKNFYSAEQNYPRLSRLFQLIIAINVLLMFVNIFGWRKVAHTLNDTQVLFATLIIFGSAFYVWKKGYHPALYMILARFVMMSFTAIFVLANYDVLVKNAFTKNCFYIGTTLEMIIVYLGLSIRMKNLETEKDAARENERLATVRLDWFNTLVRVITHDMSTPISIISTSVDLELRRQQPSSSLKKNLERIQRAVNQQSDLVGHVREMIAVTMGKKTLNLQPIHVQKKLECLLINFAEKIETKQVTVQLELPEEPLYILAEGTALEHTILGNIMSNAIKFSQKHAVIKVSLKRLDDRVLISFEDHGVGIPDDLLDKLFDPTQATSRPGTENEQGTGFGLPIALVYVEQFNGSIMVKTHIAGEDGESSGTVFELSFPNCENVPALDAVRYTA